MVKHFLLVILSVYVGLYLNVYTFVTFCFIAPSIDFCGDLQAIVVFLITIHAYAYEKSEMEELSMVALSGCIWLKASVVALETKYASV